MFTLIRPGAMLSALLVAVVALAEAPNSTPAELALQLPGAKFEYSSLSADGRWVAAAATDGIRIYDTASGLQLRTLPDRGRRGVKVEFSPRGHVLLLSWSTNDFELWDVVRGTLITALAARRVDFCDEGRRMRVVPFADPDRTKEKVDYLPVTDTSSEPSGTRSSPMAQGQTDTRCLAEDHWLTRADPGRIDASGPHGEAFRIDVPRDKYLISSKISSHGRYVATAYGDVKGASPIEQEMRSIVVIWDVAQQRIIHTFSDKALPVFAISASGSRLAAAGPTSAPAIYDIATGSQTCALGRPAESHGEFLFSPDERWLAYAASGQIAVFDVQQCRQLFEAKNSQQQLTFSVDGSHLLAYDQTSASVWEVRSGQHLPLDWPGANDSSAPLTSGLLRDQPSAIMTRMSISPSGQLLAAALEDAERQGSIQFIDLTGDTDPREVRGRDYDENLAGVRALAFSPDGRKFAASIQKAETVGHITQGLVGNIRIWELDRLQPIKHGPIAADDSGERDSVDQSAGALGFTPDGHQLVGGIYVSLPMRDRGCPYVQCGEDEALAYKTQIVRIDLPSGEVQRTLKNRSAYVTALALSPDGNLLASGHENHAVKLWDLKASKWIRTIGAGEQDEATERTDRDQALGPYYSFEGTIAALLFSKDGRRLYSAAEDHSRLSVWDTATGKKVAAPSVNPYELLDTPEGATALALSADGSILASATCSGTIFVISTTDWKPRFPQPLRAEDCVNDLAFEPSGRLLFANTGNGLVHIFDLRNGTLAATLALRIDPKRWAVFTPDGQWDGSEETAGQLMAWRVADKVLPFSALRDSRKSPGLLKKLLLTAK